MPGEADIGRSSLMILLSHIGDTARRAHFLMEHQAPSHRDELAVAVGVLPHHGCDVPRSPKLAGVLHRNPDHGIGILAFCLDLALSPRLRTLPLPCRRSWS